MKKYCLLIVMFSCFFSTQTFARDFLERDLLMQLYSLEDSCIIGVKENKYYLNAEKIYVVHDGIYLVSDYCGSLSVSNLAQDNEGMYTVGAYGHYICNGCGTRYQSYPSECGVCGGTSFTYVENLPPD